MRKFIKRYGAMQQKSLAEMQDDTQKDHLRTLKEAGLIKALLRETPSDPPMGKIGRLMQVWPADRGRGPGWGLWQRN